MTTAIRSRPATAKTEPPHHNNLTCYTDYRCRLPECVDRYNAWNRERLHAKKAGTYSVFVDAEPARQHILQLQRTGMSADAIAAAAGVTIQSILEFVRPIPSQGRGRRRRTTPANQAKILAVTLDDRTIGRIDATGTRRRIQALVTLGWPVRIIARHAGLADQNAHGLLQRPRVYVATAKAIATAYDDLRTRRPEKHGVTKAHIVVAKNRAARHRWEPPKYWDQHPGAIDNPNFEREVPEAPRYMRLGEDSLWLEGLGLTREQAAERLEVTKDYLDQSIRRYRIATAAAVTS
jgi:transposase